jgi:hypothetical protein
MLDTRSALDQRRGCVGLLLALGCVLVIAASRLAVIHRFGINLPYLDAWDVELPLLVGWRDGTLTWRTLIAAHNEHRPLLTRLWLLMWIAWDGAWEPRLLMSANAWLAAVAFTVMGFLLASGLTGWRRALVLTTVTLFAAIPLSWINLLAGLQSQFFFALLLQVLACHAATTARPLSARWWLAPPCILLAGLAVGSGPLAGGATACVLAWRHLRTRQAPAPWLDRRVMLACAALLVPAIVIVLTSRLGHSEHAPRTLAAAVECFLRCLAWPAHVPWMAAVVYLPLAWRMITLLRRDPARRATGFDWFLLALGVQGLLLALAIALNRGNRIYPAVQQFDLLIIGVWANLVIALRPRPTTLATWKAWLFHGSRLAWIASLLLALGGGIRHLNEGLHLRHAQTVEMKQNLRAYLRSGDERWVIQKANPFWFDARRLRGWLDDPRIVGLIPGLGPSLPYMPVPSTGDPRQRGWRYRLEPYHSGHIALEAFSPQPDLVSLTLQDDAGSGAIDLTSRQTQYHRVTGSQFTLMANRSAAAPDDALRFTHPQPVGRLTAFSEWWLRHPRTPLLAGLLCWCVAGLLALRQKAPRGGEPADPAAVTRA